MSRAPSAPRAPSLTWGALVLLAVSGFLNYFDRANLSVGAAQVQSELHLTSYQLGLLLSAFFWSYALMQLFLIAGWLAGQIVQGTGFGLVGDLLIGVVGAA